MFRRRHFLATATATAATALAGRAAAHSNYVIPEEHMPRMVRITDAFAANEIHLDPNRFFLYWTLGEGQAIRYVVGVGRPGLYEAGQFTIGAKKEWPSWRPTDDMIARNPGEYEKYKDGMPGGPTNPLGARALYLFTARGGDSFLRIHGTPQPWTVGTRVSNGCARLVNEHIAHLYEQVPLGARVVLYPMGGAAGSS